jgi:hypothetical protein
MLVRIWKKGALAHHWSECKIVQPLRKVVWRYLKNNNRTTI